MFQLVVHHLGKSEQEVKAGPPEAGTDVKAMEECYPGLLSLSYIIQDHLFMGGTIHGLGSFMSTIN